MQVRDGPAAVRGDALPPRRHWVARPGKAAGEGAPSQKTCRPPQPRTPRGRRIRAPSHHCCRRGTCRGARRRLPLGGCHQHRAHRAHRYHRIISLSPTVTEDLFAIGAGKQVIAVDQDSNYPARAPRTSLSGYTPNVEAIANYHPDLVLISYNPEQLRLAAPEARDQGRDRGRRGQPRSRRTGRSSGSAALTGHTRGATARRPLDADAPRRDRGERAEVAPAPARLPRARPDVLLGDVADVHRQHLQAVRLPGHRRRSGRDAATATRSSRPSTSSPRTRRSSSSPTRGAAGRRTRPSPRDRAGARSPPSQHHRVVLGERRRRLALGPADRASSRGRWRGSPKQG